MSKSILSNASDFNIRLDLSNTVASGIAAVLNEVNIDTTSIDDKNSVIITGIGGINTHLDTSNTTLSGVLADTTSIASDTASLDTKTDDVILGIGDTNVHLDTANVTLSGVHSDTTSIASDTASLDTKTDDVILGIAGINNHLDTLNTTVSGYQEVVVINPSWDQDSYQLIAYEEPGTDGAYDYYVDMAGVSYWSLQYRMFPGSATVSGHCSFFLEATTQDDGTAAADCVYSNIGHSEFGRYMWDSYDYQGILVRDKPLPIKYLHIGFSADTLGHNDAEWQFRLYTRKV